MYKAKYDGGRRAGVKQGHPEKVSRVWKHTRGGDEGLVLIEYFGPGQAQFEALYTNELTQSS